MIKNYITLAFRQMMRNKLNSLINLIGLSVGIACCLIIFLFVDNELKYDKYHTNADNIFRITTIQVNDGATRKFAHSYLPYSILLESQIPEIEQTVRLLPHSVSVTNKEKNIVLQEERFFYADSTLLDVFSIPLKIGDKSTALTLPKTVIISENAAHKYFGSIDVIGESLMIDQNVLLTVSGVFHNLPEQSSLKPEMIAPMSAAKLIMGPWITHPNQSWNFPQVYSFVKLTSDTQLSNISKKLNNFDKENLPQSIKSGRTHELQKLGNIHFSNLENEMYPTINKAILYIFIAAGIVILLIASFNFINLFLARVVLRLREVGIKKVLGATNFHVWQQTLIESFLYLSLSLLLSLCWVLLFLPSFNNLMDTKLELFNANTIQVWLLIVALLFLLGVLISFVPPIFLSRFKIITTLKGLSGKVFKRNNKASLQSVLVVFQFTIAVVLMTATIIMQSQMSFIKNKDLGLNQEKVIIIPVRDDNIQNNFSTLKNKLLQNISIQSVSSISNFPWEKGYYNYDVVIGYNGNEFKANSNVLLIDHDFIPTMEIKTKKGREFSREFSTDSTAFIMNETAANLYGFDSEVGASVEMYSSGPGQLKKGKLIGIVEDFHLQSLHKKVEPLILTIPRAKYFTDNIIVRFSGKDITATLTAIQSDVQEISPDRPFEYFFLDEAIAKLYQKETRISSLFNYFSLLAIIIACLGLLGIVSFTTSQRIKEIGIRKVLGATVINIVKLITISFLKLVTISILIAVPVSYLFMSNWLENFTYRVNLSWEFFLFTGIIALAIAILTIGYQSIQAAVTNPIKCLRME